MRAFGFALIIASGLRVFLTIVFGLQFDPMQVTITCIVVGIGVFMIGLGTKPPPMSGAKDG